MSKEKLQEKYVLYQILGQNLESLNQQMKIVEQQFAEVKMTALSLDDIKKVEKNNEIFLPLGSGLFGKGMITEKNSMLVNAGAGIFLNKNLTEAKKTLEEREKELEKASVEIREQAQKVTKQINELSIEIQELASKEGKS